jgi:hypothetical protein
MEESFSLEWQRQGYLHAHLDQRNLPRFSYVSEAELLSSPAQHFLFSLCLHSGWNHDKEKIEKGFLSASSYHIN